LEPQPANPHPIEAALGAALPVKLRLNATLTRRLFAASMRADFMFRVLGFQAGAAVFLGVNALQEFLDFEADESLKNRNFLQRQS
jgi:hypothetical protein